LDGELFEISPVLYSVVGAEYLPSFVLIGEKTMMYALTF
jgi:hypothetical protein